MSVRQHAAAWAIGASVAVHGVLFAALWRPQRDSPPTTPSKTTPLAVQVLSRAPAERVEGLPPLAAPAAQVRVARAAPTRSVSPPTAARGEGDVLEEAPEDVGTPSGGGAALGGPPSAAGGAKLGGAPGGSSGGNDAASWGALHDRLESAARECYPDAAKRFRLRGEVELDFCVGPGGHAVNARLEGSTGSGALDRAAQECVLSRAEPLGVDSGCFRVPIRFGTP